MEEIKVIAPNKKIHRDFEIFDTLEVGLELRGYEAQSARKGHISLDGSYIRETNREFYVHNLFIAQNPSIHTHLSERRKKRLLMHKNEIIRWSSKVKEKGLTVLPIDMHIKNNRIKLTIALVRRKKLFGNKNRIEEKRIKEETRNVRRFR